MNVISASSKRYSIIFRLLMETGARATANSVSEAAKLIEQGFD